MTTRKKSASAKAKETAVTGKPLSKATTRNKVSKAASGKLADQRMTKATVKPTNTGKKPPASVNDDETVTTATDAPKAGPIGPVPRLSEDEHIKAYADKAEGSRSPEAASNNNA